MSSYLEICRSVGCIFAELLLHKPLCQVRKRFSWCHDMLCSWVKKKNCLVEKRVKKKIERGRVTLLENSLGRAKMNRTSATR